MNTQTQTIRQPEVREHPAGGFTIAVPVGSGTARVYQGQFDTIEAAAAAMAGAQKARAA